MGKSVFLRQVAEALGRRDDVRVRLMPAPLTVESMMASLADVLGVEARRPLHAHQLLESFFAVPENPRRLVLIFDELDRYGRPSADPSQAAPGREFFNSLEAARRDILDVGILAAGSLGVFGLRDSLGSSFLARADAVRIDPFGSGEAAELAGPFREDRRALNQAVLEALLLASGGNPALLT